MLCLVYLHICGFGRLGVDTVTVMVRLTGSVLLGFGPRHHRDDARLQPHR